MRTFVTFKCEDPKLWLEDYTINGMTDMEYFAGLISCAKSAPIDSIIQCVSKEQLKSFRDDIMDLASANSDAEIGFIGYEEPPFGLKEVRRFKAWFEANESQGH